MPVATYGPLASKFGRVEINSTVMNLSEHECRASGEDIDTTHFESDTGQGGANVWGEGLVGIVDADIMVRGKFDGLNNPMITPIFLYPGSFGTAFLGMTKTYGFTSGYRCLQTPVQTMVRQAATMEARLKSNGVMTLPAGNVA